MKNRPALDMDDCTAIGRAAQEEARQHGWPVSIAILDDGGHLLHFVRMDGASAASADISHRKAHTAALTGRASKAYEDRVAVGRTAVLSMPFLMVQGGLPIIVDGTCIGAVGVSGVESHQDEQVARVGIEALGLAGQ